MPGVNGGGGTRNFFGMSSSAAQAKEQKSGSNKKDAANKTARPFLSLIASIIRLFFIITYCFHLCQENDQ